MTLLGCDHLTLFRIAHNRHPNALELQSILKLSMGEGSNNKMKKQAKNVQYGNQKVCWKRVNAIQIHHTVDEKNKIAKKLLKKKAKKKAKKAKKKAKSR